MKPSLALLACLLLPAFPSPAQERDFLSADEIDQVREAQDPSLRIRLYLQFAKERIGLVEKLVSESKPGRSLLIHDTLEDYEKIIEAIDTVADDSLKRHLPIQEGVTAAAAAEKKMLASLKKIGDLPLPDKPRYEFALGQAVDATEDSIDLSSEDVGKRSTEVAAQQAREVKQREEGMSDSEVAAKKKDEKTADTKKRKAPSLLKPGEKAQVQ